MPLEIGGGHKYAPDKNIVLADGIENCVGLVGVAVKARFQIVDPCADPAELSKQLKAGFQ